MPKKDISEYNQSWGICGFTSALTHLYDSDSRLKSKIDAKDGHVTRLGLLAEVLSFLRYVTKFRSDLIDGLNELNKDLKSPSMKDGVAGFIPLAEKAVRDQVSLEDSNEYQCALTAEALTLYLQEICDYKKAKLTTGSDPGGRGILGVMSEAGALLHWVYRDADGTVYNWGSELSPKEWETDKEYGLKYGPFHHVGCHISFG
jgi:hypothetical protein